MSSRLARLGLSTILSGSLLLTPVAGALACTSMLLPAKDGGFVYGRTLEFGLDLKSQLIVIPRNITFTGTGPQGVVGQGGMTWKSKYAATGANALGLPVVLDGFNEKGLAGGLFNFPGYADFQVVPPGKEKQSLASFELLTYILTNFATVDEVKAGVPKIFVCRRQASAVRQHGAARPLLDPRRQRQEHRDRIHQRRHAQHLRQPDARDDELAVVPVPAAEPVAVSVRHLRGAAADEGRQYRAWPRRAPATA